MFTILTHLAYFSIIILLGSTIPQGYLGNVENVGSTLLIVGFLGAWRYTWAMINFVRAIIFRRMVFPARKALAFRRYRNWKIRTHAYFLITSYMVEPQVTVQVYRALFLAASRSKDGATIVSSVVHGADERLIRQIYESCKARMDLSNVHLNIDRIPANGKRDALAQTLRIIGSYLPTRNDILVFVDGDTSVPADIVEQSAPHFTYRNVGALTTDEGVLIEKKNLFRDWFILRFNQRQVMMCSMGLSNRVLTLTGRMSVFRADLATKPEFIDQVEEDFLDHWRLGRVKFLTGDDKSTWYWLLRNGYEMAYLPDVQALSAETQPRETFFASSRVLMVRWFGNMMRTNGRALRLNPRKIGFFTWWSILDQRMSMWTTLTGPLAVFLTAVFHSPAIVPLYIAWVMLTRYFFCIIIALFRGEWFPISHPPILYFSQVFGAAVKTFVFFRLDKQKWTRQTSTGKRIPVAIDARLKAYESTAHHAVAIAFLTIAIMFLTKV
ncbi:MAG: glycosyltransferase family 2 protein [Rhodobacteraceae bacterium]|nr:glycosyltransferase family 2 protein [Paracoccaceae bacterium]